MRKLYCSCKERYSCQGQKNNLVGKLPHRFSILFCFARDFFEKVWAMGRGRAKLLSALYCTLAIQCKFSYYELMQSGKKLGENLRKLRLKKNLSQGDLAKALGVDRAYISNIENGRMNPTLSTLEKIAGALGISSSELLK